MKKIKRIAIFFIGVICIIGLLLGYSRSKDWTVRFQSELNEFFGKDNWEVVSSESKKSLIFREYGSGPDGSQGGYKNWYIQFDNKNGEEEVWDITNHTLKINNSKYGLLSSKRLTPKQAFTLELRDISFGLVDAEIFDEIIKSELPEKEAECIDVNMSFYGGYPEPKFYDELAKEPWFNIKDVTAEDYLTSNLHDFYLNIFVYDSNLNKLTASEKQKLFDSMKNIEEKLLTKFGKAASFKLYFDIDHQVEYVKGQKQ